MQTDAFALTISRHIKAPPAPIECQVVKLDMRPGGGFETRMREGDGPFQPHVEGCFLDIVPASRLVFTTVLTEGWKPFEPWLALTAIITLTADVAGTLYAARVLHRNAADAAKHDEMGFQQGWGMWRWPSCPRMSPR